MIRAVVLLGAPGAGKSTIGAELGRRGLRWRDWEADLVRRWGGREAFVAAKDHALAALHDEQRAWIVEHGPVAVLESTGLSDAPFLDELQQAGTVLVVRADVSLAAALRRIDGREHGRHLSDELARNEAVWRAFHEHVAPHRRVDLVIDTDATGVDEAAGAVLAAVSRSSRGPRGCR